MRTGYDRAEVTTFSPTVDRGPTLNGEIGVLDSTVDLPNHLLIPLEIISRLSTA